MPPTTHHSHRSTTNSTAKPFKSRHASKSAVKERAKGKIESSEQGCRRTAHQQVMSKLERKNRAKQLRQNHRLDREDKASIFSSKDGASRIVSIVPLCPDVNVQDVIQTLNTSVNVDDNAIEVHIPRFKQRLHYLTPARELVQCMDACRVADFVLFVMSAGSEVDDLGERIVRCVESQGVSTVLTGIVGLNRVQPEKKKSEVLRNFKSFITRFFATQEKVHDLAVVAECCNVMRGLCASMPRGIRWRDDRSWMLVDDWKVNGDSVILTGTVRGKPLKADRLVQLGDWGDFQIATVRKAHPASRQEREKSENMHLDAPGDDEVLEQPTDEQDDLADLAPEVDMAVDMTTAEMPSATPKGVLLDDHHYFEKDEDHAPAPKRLPKGTSKYQAAWYLDDVSDSGSDLDDVEEDHPVLDAATVLTSSSELNEMMHDPTEAGEPSEYPQSEAFLDESPEDEREAIAEYRARRHAEAENDLDFPDEIELHPHVNARERLARYRGLKNLRTSEWERSADRHFEPEIWTRLLEIANYKSARNRVMKEALSGGVKPGTRVNVHIRIPPERLAQVQSSPKPSSLFSLLRHEHKNTVVNMSITLSSEALEPLKSKQPLIVQCGARRLLIQPIFSDPTQTANKVNKYHRYLYPGQTATASFIGPMTWSSVPCVFLLPDSLQLIGTGTNLGPSTERVVVKRAVVTGHPYKIHKKLVTVRYMFFSAEDVRYFQALQLWTKRGRSGFIKEPLGTHGYFKATFDGKVNPLDSVAVSLYKRVFPRLAQAWTPGCGGDVNASQKKIEDGSMDME